MRKTIFLLIAMGLAVSAQASHCDPSRVQKVYVNAEDIQFRGADIYVWNGQGWFPVDGILTDGIGLYYELYRFIDPIIEP